MKNRTARFEERPFLTKSLLIQRLKNKKCQLKWSFAKTLIGEWSPIRVLFFFKWELVITSKYIAKKRTKNTVIFLF
jgi:hypothetical protein